MRHRTARQVASMLGREQEWEDAGEYEEEEEEEEEEETKKKMMLEERGARSA